MTVQDFKEWIALFSDFAWPVVILFIVVIYRDVVAHRAVCRFDVEHHVARIG